MRVRIAGFLHYETCLTMFLGATLKFELVDGINSWMVDRSGAVIHSLGKKIRSIDGYY